MAIGRNFKESFQKGLVSLEIGYKGLDLLNKLTNKDFKVKSRIFWVDERCVEPTSDESNYGSAHKNFLSKMNIPKENIFRIKGEKKSSEEAQSYTRLLSKEVDLIDNLPSFDLCILGIGGDGHTASIFPHELDKLIKINHCVVGTNPESGQKRVSLSLNQINNSKEVIIHACGSGKREVCLLYTSPSPRDATLARMPSAA